VNVLNPDRFVAARNLARFDAIHKIDAGYLGGALGPDAIPVTVGLLKTLPPADRFALLRGLCVQLPSLNAEPSWRSDNLGRSNARRALSEAGVTQATCENVLRKPPLTLSL
jgi:uncharacterized protein DUF4153